MIRKIYFTVQLVWLYVNTERIASGLKHAGGRISQIADQMRKQRIDLENALHSTQLSSSRSTVALTLKKHF